MRNKPSSVACPVQLEAVWLNGHREETQEKGHACPPGMPPTRCCQVCTHRVTGLGAKAAISVFCAQLGVPVLVLCPLCSSGSLRACLLLF